MDLAQTIKALYDEKAKLDQVIASLEKLQTTASSIGVPAGHRRGRKSMDAKEREEVSRRMKNYWASRRKQKS